MVAVGATAASVPSLLVHFVGAVRSPPPSISPPAAHSQYVCVWPGVSLPWWPVSEDEIKENWLVLDQEVRSKFKMKRS